MTTISRAELASLFTLSERRINQLVRDGVLPQPTKGMHELDSVRAYVQHIQNQVRGGMKSEAAERVANARADAIELRTAREERRLVPIEDVSAALDSILGTLIEGLHSVPGQVTDDVRLRRRIEDAIDAVRAKAADRLDAVAKALRRGEDPLADPVGATSQEV